MKERKGVNGKYTWRDVGEEKEGGTKQEREEEG